MKLFTQLTALLLFLTLFIVSCDTSEISFGSAPDDDGGPPYSIKEVEVTPDTVAPGDTATFKAIADGEVELIEQYQWVSFYGVPKTDTNVYHWVADSVLGTRTFIVTIPGNAKYPQSNEKRFQIVVEE
ncbi:MAG: hypothetical protein WD267_07755 [Balneolales bacterium]